MRSMYHFSMYALFVIALTDQLFSLPSPLVVVGSCLAIGLFLVSSLWVKPTGMWLTTLLALVLGHLLFWHYQLGFDHWYEAITKGMALPVLFVVIPLIAVPIRNGGYLESMEQFIASKREQPGRLFLSLAVINLALVIALNIGALPLFQKLVEKANLPKKFLSRFYTAVYSSYMVFSPYDPFINMLLLFLGMTYADYVLPGLLLVSLALTIGVVLIQSDRALLKELGRSLPYPSGERGHRKLLELLMHIVALIIFAALGSRSFPEVPSIYVIACIMGAYSIFWTVIVKATGAMREELSRYSDNFDVYQRFLPFLVSLAFFGSIVSLTPMSEYIGKVLIMLNELPPYFVFQGCMLLVTLLSLCGIHMIMPVTTLALTVTPEMIGLSKPAYMMLLLASWVPGMVVSPLVPFVIIVAETIKERATRFAWKLSPPVVILWILVAPLLVMGVNSLTG